MAQVLSDGSVVTVLRNIENHWWKGSSEAMNAIILQMLVDLDNARYIPKQTGALIQSGKNMVDFDRSAKGVRTRLAWTAWTVPYASTLYYDSYAGKRTVGTTVNNWGYQIELWDRVIYDHNASKYEAIARSYMTNVMQEHTLGIPVLTMDLEAIF